MKLTETTDLQQSSEELWDGPYLSFSFVTRDRENNDLIEREYEFAHAKEWDEWVLSSYQERRCDETERIDLRNWRTVEDHDWDDPGASDVDVPEEVLDKLATVTSIDNINLRT
jgi:hypothetical protein